MLKRDKVTDGEIEYHYAVITARNQAKVTFSCQAQNNFGQVRDDSICLVSH